MGDDRAWQASTATPTHPHPTSPPFLTPTPSQRAQVDQQALARRKSDRAAKAGTNADLKENKPAKKTATALDDEAERERQLAAMVCSIDNKDACLMCSG